MVTTACAPNDPPRAEVSERFAIELASGIGEPADWTALADQLADDALDGRCGEDAYLVGLGDEPYLVRAWATTCLMYFEHDMSDEQREAARATVAAGLLER